MKRFSFLPGLLLLCTAFSAAAWSPPPVAKKTLPGGLRLYLLKDAELPIFQASLVLPAGSAHDPRGKGGVSQMTAALLVQGGTAAETPESLDRRLDAGAIRLGYDVGRELMTITVSSLAEQWREALEVLRAVALTPRWDAGRFSYVLQGAREKLIRDEDDPEIVAAKTFQELLYGPSHPWGQMATLRSLKKIGIGDLRAFFHSHFFAGNAILAVAGDFSPKAVEKWGREFSRRLPAGEKTGASWPILPFENSGRTKRISKKVNQLYIAAGHLALPRGAEGYHAYTLLHYVLGGDVFVSRLGKDIRTSRGLAYSVGSYWASNPVRGFFKIHAQTKAGTGPEVLRAIRRHLRAIAGEKPVTAEELALAKKSLRHQYIFWFTSPFEVVLMQAGNDLTGYPEDFLTRYREKLEAVTLEEVQTMARKYIRPEALTLVVVGP